MLSDNEFLQLAQFFQNMKYIHGAEFVNATLRRHQSIKKALLDYENEFIMRVESNLKGDD